MKKGNIFRNMLLVLLAGIGFVLLIQLIPYGRNHTNPAVVSAPNWDSVQTRELAEQACFDCHSNETVWPWYSNIAPVSWLIQHDVEEGRSRLNFSDMGTQRVRANKISNIVVEGEMPPVYYLPMHPAANLTAAQRQQLAQGLIKTLGQ